MIKDNKKQFNVRENSKLDVILKKKGIKYWSSPNFCRREERLINLRQLQSVIYRSSVWAPLGAGITELVFIRILDMTHELSELTCLLKGST
jgi:hypothetical protein